MTKQKRPATPGLRPSGSGMAGRGWNYGKVPKKKQPVVTGSAKKDRYEAWADALYSHLPAREKPRYEIRFRTQQLGNGTWRIAATLPEAMVEEFGREKFLQQASSAWEVSLTRIGLTIRLRKSSPT